MKQAQLIIGGVLAIALAVGIGLFGAHYMRLQRAAAQNEHRGGVLTSTSEGVKDGEYIEQLQAAFEAGLVAGRETFQESKQEAIDNDPSIRERAYRPVPDRLRDAYRERRLSRERLGCAGSECEEGRQADPATERPRVLR